MPIFELVPLRAGRPLAATATAPKRGMRSRYQRWHVVEVAINAAGSLFVPFG